MSIEKYAAEIVTGVFILASILLLLAAFHYSKKRAEAKAKGDETNANLYKACEQFCALFCVGLCIMAGLNINHSSVIDYLQTILTELRMLKHG